MEAELVLAVSGVLDPTAPDQDTFGVADALATKWDTRLRRWVRGKDTKPFKMPKKRDLQKTRQQLGKVLFDDRREQLVEAFQTVDPVMGADFLGALDEAREHLFNAFPLETLDGVMGVEEMAPAHDDAARWLAMVAVVEDPERFLDEIEMNSLEPAQVEAFKASYPGLWLETQVILLDEVAKMRQQKVSFLPYDRQATIRTLGAQGFDAPIVPAAVPQPPVELPKAKPLDLSTQQAPADRLLKPL